MFSYSTYVLNVRTEELRIGSYVSAEETHAMNNHSEYKANSIKVNSINHQSPVQLQEHMWD